VQSTIDGRRTLYPDKREALALHHTLHPERSDGSPCEALPALMINDVDRHSMASIPLVPTHPSVNA
jgi:hypothetical protein